MTAVGALALYDAEQLLNAADIIAAMTLEAVKGKSAPFSAGVHVTRPHAGQAKSSAHIRRLIRGSQLVDVNDADTGGKVQDSYSIRCIPQVHGASRDAVAYVRYVLETEINSATDNPLIFPEGSGAVSAGNFHGQPVALVMDFLGLAVSEIGNISERRTAKLMDKHHNAGLPAFLAPDGGVESGLMIAQYTAAALVSENKTLIHPASGDSIPTSANQEDHVSMGTIAARQSAEIVRNVQKVLAIELLSASQALSLRREKPGIPIRTLLSRVRKAVPPFKTDASLSEAIESLSNLIASGNISDLLRQS
jgi:histidine ammonia-lyase